MEGIIEHPKVFISYSWDTENGDGEHKKWVRDLATKLRSHGVDVILDQFDLRLGDDLPFFMEQGLTTSHLVICICSEKYTEKANAVTKGVGYEKRILANDLLSDSNKKFIIPIVRNNHLKKKLPTFLSGSLYVDFDNEDFYNAYRALIERIYNIDTSKKPPLGTCPFVGNTISDEITTKLNIEKVNFCNTNMDGNVSFDYKKNSGLYIIGTSDYSFTTKWSECGCNSIYCYNDQLKRIGYNPEYTQFPKKEELKNFDYSSRARCLKVGEIIILENTNHRFAAIKVLNVRNNDVDINHLLEFEYTIYETL